jgi:Zn-dependent peptidase ImmA (M78 family)
VEYDLGDDNSDDVRAFCLETEISIIVLNENDIAPVRLFSLFHEVCHLIRHESGICFPKEEETNRDKAGRASEETFCNRFAAKFLMPSDDVDILAKEYPDQVDYKALKKMAGWFSVSGMAMSIELNERHKAKALSNRDYEKQIEDDEEEQEKKKQEKKARDRRAGRRGGMRKGYWDDYFKAHVGNFALSTIETEYRDGKISYQDAMDISGLNSNYTDKFFGLA